ncbi:MAG: lysophospholipid acyltransferase family protein [Anaerolineales bacterium]|nr:lysophospholipid acyltransferase family protein [Chloroflexota bacterium]MBL7162131.1 lysophospholipid acyltransferase family protein [Anaerolineales bacterium]
MKLDFQSLSSSRFGVNLALWIGRTMPPVLSYRIANFGANLLAKRDNAMTQAIRANQWVIRGENSSPEELDQAVREVFQHAGRGFADLYHNLMNPEGIKRLCPLTASIEKLLEINQPDTPGAFIVAPHLSAFDIALLALAYHGLRGKVLTYGNPPGGYELQNEIRASTGLEITPVLGEETHLEAIEYMRQGGAVITAVDRPIRKKAHTLTFFGRPSPLPAGHIRMALEADMPVIIAAAQMTEAGKYRINISDPIPMVPHSDPDIEIRQNAEAVLKAIEEFIRLEPGQWLMYYPAWPEVMMNGER